MDITTILNEKGAAAAVAAEAQQLQQHLAQQASNMGSQTPSDRDSEHGTPQNGDQTSSYPPPPTSHPLQQLSDMHQYQQAHALPVGTDYLQNTQHYVQPPPPAPARGTGAPAPKSFHCQTCHKAFARRSDLSRHGKFPTRNS